jgi:hypothetical protein
VLRDELRVEAEMGVLGEPVSEVGALSASELELPTEVTTPVVSALA